MNINKFQDLVYNAAVDECRFLSDIVPSVYYIDPITNKLGYFKIPNDYLEVDVDIIIGGIKSFINDFIETHEDVEYYSILMMSNEFKIDIGDKDIDDLIDDDGILDMNLLLNDKSEMQRIINICDYGKSKNYPQTRRLYVDDNDKIIGEDLLEFSIIDEIE